MRFRTGSTLAVITAAGLLAGTVIPAQAAEIGFLEMLFGARPAPQPVQQAQPPGAPDIRAFERRATPRLGSARHRLQTRYAALPVRIRVKETELSPRQTPIDMKSGAAAALMKDETLQPGDIVVLNTGAKVFTGNPDKRHAIRDFEPVQSSRFVSKGTRKQLAGLFTPIGASPANEARRVVARGPQSTPPIATPIPHQQTAMRVINVWKTAQ
ncbi:hypothetical protein [Methylobacterium pseudosasicola]|uniref:Uncharacterized protein n=1 Tax=Methylobacterium pseudosasicola TaxID=582667 RepID=A0A1I4T4M7_9HYPH|nr:hypothetical protein [Methylobacterium pseudosasicola]SFM71672.1 hypothetical protein SAMN05192568_104921 [Methylobacterium pseudosasicola]